MSVSCLALELCTFTPDYHHLAFTLLTHSSVTITSILRLQSLISFSENTNVTWSFYNVALWSTIEIGVGVFCANMPVLRLMFVWMFPNAAGSTARKTPLYYHKASDEGRSAASSHARGHLASVNRAEQKGGLDGHGGIMFQKSYEVQYTDNDEVGLVDMERNQRPGTASPSRSNPGTAM